MVWCSMVGRSPPCREGDTPHLAMCGHTALLDTLGEEAAMVVHLLTAHPLQDVLALPRYPVC